MKRKKPANPAYPGRVAAQRRQETIAARALKREAAQKRQAAAVAGGKPKAVRVSQMALHTMSAGQLGELGLTRMGEYVVKQREFKAPRLFPGVVPAGANDRRRYRQLPGESAHIALDSATVAPMYAWANQFCSAVGFPGYPYLAELALRSEYRSAAETTAKEMTRRWIKLKSAAAGEKDDKIKALTEALEEFRVRALFRTAIENDYYFGSYRIYMNIKGQDSDAGRQLPFNITDESGALGKGCLLGLAGVEPIWTTPYSYNSIDPTSPDFFKPTSWFILGKKTHATRLLPFISRPVPDLFKPAYNFGGISMSQLMEPYVMQWYRTRDSVSDMVYNYSTSGVATNLASLLDEDNTGASLQKRAQLFNQIKGNRGLMLLDKDTEEFFQFNTPLSGLDKLQAQAQEHMCEPSHTPAVKLLGVQPTGLNANSDGEITVYNDFLHSEQEGGPDDNLKVILKTLQFHLFGSYDPDIQHVWIPLSEPTQTELAKIRLDDAQAGQTYIAGGVIAPEEERNRLQMDPDSGYDSLEGPAPEMTPEEELAAQGQEHASGEADADRTHGAEQADKDRKVKAAKPPAKKA